LDEAVYVLDSTAFYAGIPYQGRGRYYTTYFVLEEVKHQSVGSSLLHTRVQVTEPSVESLQRVKAMAAKTGDSNALSKTDVSLLALALDLSKDGDKVNLVSDDFAVRNVAPRCSGFLCRGPISRASGSKSLGRCSARVAGRSTQTQR